MSLSLTLGLCATMLITSFLSGIFGMAGGMILMGILLGIMPLPAAMMLHGATQMASNGWRGLLWYRRVRWLAVAAYGSGCMVALLLWSLVRYVPDRPSALLLLGVMPFAVQLAPAQWRPHPEALWQGIVCGSICMTMILLAGVAGPLVDTYFLGGTLDRREIVATKATCQIFGHAAKLVYFGGIIDQVGVIEPFTVGLAIAASMVGTTLASHVLEAMSDRQYRLWANRIIVAVAASYIAHGTYLILSS